MPLLCLRPAVSVAVLKKTMIVLDGTESKDSNIINIHGEPLEMKEIERKSDFCSSHHKKINVDEHERMIVCRECGKVIDPFNYILGWAREGTRRMQRLDAMDAEIRTKHQQLEEVKTALAREKARVRKINPDAPEVITWRRQMSKFSNRKP